LLHYLKRENHNSSCRCGGKSYFYSRSSPSTQKERNITSIKSTFYCLRTLPYTVLFLHSHHLSIPSYYLTSIFTYSSLFPFVPFSSSYLLPLPSSHPHKPHHSYYTSLSPKTRLMVGGGIIGYACLGLFLSDTAEEKLGFTPSEEDKKRLREALPKIRVVED
jgi:hypothetical protein